MSRNAAILEQSVSRSFMEVVAWSSSCSFLLLGRLCGVGVMQRRVGLPSDLEGLGRVDSINCNETEWEITSQGSIIKQLLTLP